MQNYVGMLPTLLISLSFIGCRPAALPNDVANAEGANAAHSAEQDSSPTTSTINEDHLSAWNSQELASGAVRIKLPAEASRQEKIGVTSKGPTQVVEFMARDESGRIFEAIETTLPAAAVTQGPTPADTLRRFARARMVERGASPKETVSIDAPLPGLEQHFTVPGSIGISQPQDAIERHYLYGNIVITLHTETTSQDAGESPSQPAVQEAFLSSIKVLEDPPGSNEWREPAFPDDPNERALLEARVKNWGKFEGP